jgi:L-threonylcarbamoyladenylate synthase
MNAWQISQAVRALRQGGVIAYPTEAVWGLGCDPNNEAALHKLLSVKQRPIEKGVILVAASTDQIAPLYDPLKDDEKAKLNATWPGPNTWLLPDPNDLIPAWVKGEHRDVAIRISAHPLVKALCEAFDGPIVSTSANPATLEPAKDLLKVNTYFRRKIDFILPGALGGLDRPTQIRSLRSGAMVRA